jgi:hypothetical protein
MMELMFDEEVLTEEVKKARHPRDDITVVDKAGAGRALIGDVGTMRN